MKKTLLRIGLIAAVVTAFALLVAQDQQTLQITAAVTASDPTFPEYATALTGSPTTKGNQYEIFINGERVFPAMLEAIRTATRRVNFETYIFSPGTLSSQFTDALAAAARRGVEVNIVFDAIGTSDIDDVQVRRLTDAGCRIGWFNPVRWHFLEYLNYRTHRKLLVVDGQVAFTGGMSVADHWLGNAQDPDHWRDTHVRITGSAVSYLDAVFFENWADTGFVTKPVFFDPVSAPPEPPDGAGRTLVVRSSPTGGGGALKWLYLLSIAGASRTIDISSPYFITDESTMWALEQARRRGVRIRVLVEGDLTDAKPVKFAGRSAYEHLLEVGLEIYEYQPTMMHAKVMVIDDVWSVLGSANFDNRSLELNDELNVAVWSAEIAKQFGASFAADLRISRQLKLDEWRDRPLLEKTREWFWSSFSELF